MIATKRRRLASIVGFLMVGATCLAAAGASEEVDPFDLAGITCWDAMVLEEEERNALLFLVYGYVAGQESRTLHSEDQIRNKLRNVGEFCAATPDATVLETMARASDSSQPPDPNKLSSHCPVVRQTDWHAWIDRGSDDSSGLRLNIAGKVEAPSPGFDFSLERGPLDRRQPPSLRVTLTATPPSGPTIQVITSEELSFTLGTEISRYRSIIVLCGDQQLAEILDIELTD